VRGSNAVRAAALTDQGPQPGSGVLREKGLGGAMYTVECTRGQVLDTLAGGQALPLGVVRVEGTVTRLEGGGSSRHPNSRVGDRHQREFPGSGRWGLVTGFEGERDQPTAFFVNDSDLGGALRCAPAPLDSMGAGRGSFRMVRQAWRCARWERAVGGATHPRAGSACCFNLDFADDRELEDVVLEPVEHLGRALECLRLFSRRAPVDDAPQITEEPFVQRPMVIEGLHFEVCRIRCHGASGHMDHPRAEVQGATAFSENTCWRPIAISGGPVGSRATSSR